MIQIFCGAKLIMVLVIESPLTGHFSDIYRIFGSYIRVQRKWHDWKKVVLSNVKAKIVLA